LKIEEEGASRVVLPLLDLDRRKRRKWQRKTGVALSKRVAL
jgi:hypothetical protein